MQWSGPPPAWLLGIVAAIPTPGTAATPTASFEVAATIVSGCEINGAAADGGDLGRYGTVDFGTHSALKAETVTATVTPEASVTLACTPGVSLTVSLDGGLHGDGSRNMKAAGGNALQPYKLFSDAGHTQEYGVGQSHSFEVASSQAIALPIYGRTDLGGQNPPDVYSDTVVVTLSW